MNVTTRPNPFKTGIWMRAGWVALLLYLIYAASRLEITWARFLVGLEPRMSLPAMAKSLASAQPTGELLRRDADWIVLETVSKLVDHPRKGNRAGAILEELRGGAEPLGAIPPGA